MLQNNGLVIPFQPCVINQKYGGQNIYDDIASSE